jgi:hypothetical protein
VALRRDNELKLFNFYRGHSVVYIKRKDNKIVSDFSQTQQYILFYFYLDDMFHSTDHHQTSLQNLESGTSSANGIHAIWDPIRFKNILNSIKFSIKRMVFIACEISKFL